MVRLNITGANTFDWIATKYIRDGSYNNNCTKNFEMSCFVGTSATKDQYTVKLVAIFTGK